MRSNERPLSDRFDEELRPSTPDLAAWRNQAEHDAGGRFERLQFSLTDDLVVQPLYTEPPAGHSAGTPGEPPFGRGSSVTGSVAGGWDIRQPHRIVSLEQTNRAICEDLAGGATSILLQLECGSDAVSATTHELAIADVDELDRVLDGVHLQMIGAALESGASFAAGAAILSALWERRKTPRDAAVGAFHADPLGTAVRNGGLPQGIDRALDEMGALAAWTRSRYKRVTAVAVDAGVWHDAGANVVQDLAISLATGVEYLRAMERSGLSPAQAARQIVFRFSVGSEFFLEIAKLRAARMLWARVLGCCSGDESVPGMRQEVRTARRAMTRRDPWVNILRNTACCFIGVAAGSETVTSVPFDETIGEPDAASRRLARNTQVLLHEESHLNKVIDPAGGSWAVENLTAELCAAAWVQFTNIESEGGAVAALRAGSLQRQVEAAAKERSVRVAYRKRPLLGVSEFANLAETLPQREPQIRRARRPSGSSSTAHIDSHPQTWMEAALALAGAAGICDRLWQGSTAESVSPVRARRLDEPYEELRIRSESRAASTGVRPQVLLACMGRLADHNARSSFAANLLGAGGIAAVTPQGSADVGSLVDAANKSGCKDAILCSSDPLYEQWGLDAARALKRAGVRRLLLAGFPGDRQAAWESAGIDDFVYIGCNALAVLQSLLSLQEEPA